MARKQRRRAYNSSSRQESARATRQAILTAARKLFLRHGYAATTMPDIAKAADVALDTVYAVVGKKPALFRLLVETAISGGDEAVAAEQRDYVQMIRGEHDASRKLRIYAAALCKISAASRTALQRATGSRFAGFRFEVALAGDRGAAGGKHAFVRRRPRIHRKAAPRTFGIRRGRYHLEHELAGVLPAACRATRLVH